MALKSSIAGPQTFKKDNRRSIEKHDFSHQSILTDRLKNIQKKAESIIEKHNTNEETQIIKVYKYDKDITMNNILENNVGTILNNIKLVYGQGLAGLGAGADDRRRILSQLQKNVLKSFASEPVYYDPFMEEKQMQNYYIYLNQKVEAFRNEYKALELVKAKSSNWLWALIGSSIIVYATPVVVGIGFNYLMIVSINNPSTWISLSQLLFNNIGITRVHFQLLSDVFYTLGYYSIADIASFTKLYDEMEIYIKKSDAIKDPQIINNLIKQVFESPENIQDYLESQNISPDNDIYKFYKFIYDNAKKKDFINPVSDEASTNANTTWYNIVLSFFQTNPQMQFALSSLRLVTNCMGYIKTTKEIFNKYQSINNLIIFDTAIKYGFKTKSWNQAIYYLTQQGLTNLFKFIQTNDSNGFVIGAVQKYGLDKVNKFLQSYIPDFFALTISGGINMTVTSYTNSFFDGIKKQAEDTLKQKQKTEKEQILTIEQEVIKIAQYKKEGYSNEEIAELLDPTPEEPSNYKLLVSKFIVGFNRQFNKFNKSPEKYLSSAIKMISFTHAYALCKSFIFGSRNIYLSGLTTTILAFVTHGSAIRGVSHLNINDALPKDASKWLPEGSISDLLTLLIKTYYGNNNQIQIKLKWYKEQIVKDIMNDILLFHTDMQNMFFNSKVGISIASYFKNINDGIIGSMINISCKLLYYTIGIQYMNKNISLIIDPFPIDKLNFDDILNDKVKLEQFCSFINIKISNIFNSMKRMEPSKMYKEFVDLYDVSKIMQTMVLPFTNSEGYILFYNRENEENLKGNIISIASGTNKNIKKDYFVTDVDRQTKLTPAQQQKLGEEATAVKKELDGLNIILDERADNVIKQVNPTEAETLYKEELVKLQAGLNQSAAINIQELNLREQSELQMLNDRETELNRLKKEYVSSPLCYLRKGDIVNVMGSHGWKGLNGRKGTDENGNQIKVPIKTGLFNEYYNTSGWSSKCDKNSQCNLRFSDGTTDIYQQSEVEIDFESMKVKIREKYEKARQAIETKKKEDYQKYLSEIEGTQAELGDPSLESAKQAYTAFKRATQLYERLKMELLESDILTKISTLRNQYDTLNNQLNETPEIIVTLFSSDQLMVFFTEQMSKTQTSSNQIITGKQTLYDIFYAYYQQKYDKLQERSENPEEDTKEKYPDFGEYLNGEYSNLFRKIHPEYEVAVKLFKPDLPPTTVPPTSVPPTTVPPTTVPPTTELVTPFNAMQLGILGKLLELNKHEQIARVFSLDPTKYILPLKLQMTDPSEINLLDRFFNNIEDSALKQAFDKFISNEEITINAKIDAVNNDPSKLQSVKSSEIEQIKFETAAKRLLNREQMFSKDLDLTLALPNGFGFLFKTINSMDFFSISSIMNYFLNKTEMGTSSELLTDIKYYAASDPFIESKLVNINNIFNKKFQQIIKSILKFSKEIKQYFSDFNIVLKLNHIGFDYTQFTKRCVEYLKTNNLNLGTEEQQIKLIDYLLKNIIKNGKICSPQHPLNENDNDNLLIVTNENTRNNEINSPNINIDTSEIVDEANCLDMSLNEIQRKEILERLLLRPEILVELTKNSALHNIDFLKDVKNKYMINLLYDNLFDLVIKTNEKTLADAEENNTKDAKYLNLLSFTNLLKKTVRYAYMSDTIKDTLYDYFDINAQDKINDVVLDNYKTQELNQIESVCNEKSHLYDNKSSQDDKDTAIQDLYKNFRFGTDIYLGITAYTNYDDYLSNYKGYVSTLKKTKKNHQLDSKIDDIIQQMETCETHLTDYTQARIEYFKSNPSNIKCQPYDVEEMKKYIDLKYDLFKLLKQKRANNFYEVNNKNANVDEMNIVNMVSAFNKSLSNLLQQAKARNEINKNKPISLFTPPPITSTPPPGKAPPGQAPPPGKAPPGKAPPGQAPPGQKQEQEQKQEQNPEQKQKQEQKPEQNQEQKQKQEQGKKEDLQQQLQQKLNEKQESKQGYGNAVSESLRNLYALGYGGVDDFISKALNLIDNLTGTDLPESQVNAPDIKTNYDPNYKPEEGGFDTNLQWCINNYKNWYMKGNTISVRNGITEKEIIAHGCMTKSLVRNFIEIGADSIISISEGIAVIMKSSVNLIISTLKLLLTPLLWTPLFPIVSTILSFINIIAGTGNAFFLTVCECLPLVFIYYSTNALDVLKNLYPSSADFFGMIFLNISLINGIDRFKNYYDNHPDKKNYCSFIANVVGRSSQNIFTILDQKKDQIIRELSARNPVTYGSMETTHNINMNINVGLPEADNTYTHSPEYIGKMILEITENLTPEDNAILKKLDRVNFNFEKNCDFFITNNNIGIDQIIISIILNPQKIVQSYNLLNLWSFCTLLETPPPTLSEVFSLDWLGKNILKLLSPDLISNIISKIIIPLFKFLILREKTRGYILRALFGQPTVQTTNGEEINVNLFRDLIDKSFDDLLIKVKKPDGTIDDILLMATIKEQITDIFGSFFTILGDNFFSLIKNNGPPLLDPFVFNKYNEFLNSCALKFCELYSPTENTPALKDSIRAAICEILYSDSLDTNNQPIKNVTSSNNDAELNSLFSDNFGINGGISHNIICNTDEFDKYIDAQTKIWVSTQPPPILNTHESPEQQYFGILVKKLIEKINTEKSGNNFSNFIVTKLFDSNDPTKNKGEQISRSKQYFDGLKHILNRYVYYPNQEDVNKQIKDTVVKIINSTPNPDLVFGWTWIQDVIKDVKDEQKNALLGVLLKHEQVINGMCINPNEKITYILKNYDEGGIPQYEYICYTPTDVVNDYDKKKWEFQINFQAYINNIDIAYVSSNQIKLIENILTQINNIIFKASAHGDVSGLENERIILQHQINKIMDAGSEQEKKTIPDLLNAFYTKIKDSIGVDEKDTTQMQELLGKFNLDDLLKNLSNKNQSYSIDEDDGLLLYIAMQITNKIINTDNYSEDDKKQYILKLKEISVKYFEWEYKFDLSQQSDENKKSKDEKEEEREEIIREIKTDLLEVLGELNDISKIDGELFRKVGSDIGRIDANNIVKTTAKSDLPKTNTNLQKKTYVSELFITNKITDDETYNVLLYLEFIELHISKLDLDIYKSTMLKLLHNTKEEDWSGDLFWTEENEKILIPNIGEIAPEITTTIKKLFGNQVFKEKLYDYLLNKQRVIPQDAWKFKMDNDIEVNKAGKAPLVASVASDIFPKESFDEKLKELRNIRMKKYKSNGRLIHIHQSTGLNKLDRIDDALFILTDTNKLPSSHPLFNDNGHYETIITGTYWVPGFYENMYDALHNRYGMAIIPSKDSADFILIKTDNAESVHSEKNTEENMDKVYDDLKKRGISDLFFPRKDYLEYEKHLIGDITNYGDKLPNNIPPDATDKLKAEVSKWERVKNMGPPPILDLNDDCTLLNVEPEMQSFIAHFYTQFNTDNYTRCLWILNIEIDRYKSVFDNFDEHEFAKAIFGMLDEKNNIINEFMDNIELIPLQFLPEEIIGPPGKVPIPEIQIFRKFETKLSFGASLVNEVKNEILTAATAGFWNGLGYIWDGWFWNDLKRLPARLSDYILEEVKPLGLVGITNIPIIQKRIHAEREELEQQAAPESPIREAVTKKNWEASQIYGNTYGWVVDNGVNYFSTGTWYIRLNEYKQIIIDASGINFNYFKNLQIKGAGTLQDMENKIKDVNFPPSLDPLQDLASLYVSYFIQFFWKPSVFYKREGESNVNGLRLKVELSDEGVASFSQNVVAAALEHYKQ